MNFYGSFGKEYGRVKDWREAVELIGKARKLYQDKFAIMTPFERESAEQSVKELAEQYRGLIYNGAMASHSQAIEKYQDAALNVGKKTALEVARWDARRLTDERTFAEAQVRYAVQTGSRGALEGGSNVAAKLQKAYDDARISGDIYKQRALFEVLAEHGTDLVQTDSPERFEINRLAKQAEQDAEQIRITPDLVQAKQEQERAWQEYLAAREEARQAALALGEPDPEGFWPVGDFAKAFKRVTRDRETGQVEVHEPDSPQVTGVVWKE